MQETSIGQKRKKGMSQSLVLVIMIVALAIIAMLTGVNTWFREGGRLSLDEVVAQYWDMVRNAVGAVTLPR